MWTLWKREHESLFLEVFQEGGLPSGKGAYVSTAKVPRPLTARPKRSRRPGTGEHSSVTHGDWCPVTGDW